MREKLRGSALWLKPVSCQKKSNSRRRWLRIRATSPRLRTGLNGRKRWLNSLALNCNTISLVKLARSSCADKFYSLSFLESSGSIFLIALPQRTPASSLQPRFKNPALSQKSTTVGTLPFRRNASGKGLGRHTLPVCASGGRNAFRHRTIAFSQKKRGP